MRILEQKGPRITTTPPLPQPAVMLQALRHTKNTVTGIKPITLHLVGFKLSLSFTRCLLTQHYKIITTSHHTGSTVE